MARLPDFFIIGAMKAGTSSLHEILISSPAVFCPKARANFFDIDDFELHPEFYPFRSKLDYAKNFKQYIAQYKNIFSGALDHQIIGGYENSYLASLKAHERIRALAPNAKIIVMLRDPVERIYSQYAHFVRYGRVNSSLEELLASDPKCLIWRSQYKTQLENLFSHFRRDKIKIVLFEEFIQDVQKIVNELCVFLQIPKIDTNKIETHKNISYAPRSPRLVFLYNQMIGEPGILKGISYFYKHDPEIFRYPRFTQVINSLDKKFRHKFLLVKGKKIPRNKETMRYLRILLEQKNRGISRYLEKDIRKFWPYFNEELEASP